jgi:type III secretion protein J
MYRPSIRSGHRLALAVLAVALLCSCKSDLYSRVSERDANEILATLYSAGIQATKRTRDEKTWSVQVDAGDLQRALLLLSERGLPHASFSNTGELFKKEGLISTPSEERIRYIYAVSQELSNTLSQIDGVIAARVHPVIPANDPLATRPRPASASIFIKHRADADLRAMAPAIKNLVMRSIEGLGYENIALTFVAAEEPARGSKSDPAEGQYTPRTAALGLASPMGLALIGAAITSLLFALGARGFLFSQLRRRRPPMSDGNSEGSPGMGPTRWRAWIDEVR